MAELILRMADGTHIAVPASLDSITTYVILEQEKASRLAFGSLLGILNTEDRERASIFSAAADRALEDPDLLKHSPLDHQIAAARRQSSAIRPRLIAQLCLAQQHSHRRIEPPLAARWKSQMHGAAHNAALLFTRPAIKFC